MAALESDPHRNLDRCLVKILVILVRGLAGSIASSETNMNITIVYSA